MCLRYSSLWLMLVTASISVAACSPAFPGKFSSTVQPISPLPLSPSISPSPFISIPPSQIPSTILPPPSPTSAPFTLCSPLEGLAVEALAGAVVNPFQPPPPGSDNPHQGVDFALEGAGSSIALAGTPVLAALPGRVAAVIHDRFPYGNALIIETPLEALPPAWLKGHPLPTPAPTPAYHSALTCPSTPPPDWDASRRSLYLLYAHMQFSPALSPDEEMSCGQRLGQTGSSGNALNPHLHLEARLGPANARFSSLAHYDSSATLEEMSNYCQWRVSGEFQLVNPLKLFSR